MFHSEYITLHDQRLVPRLLWKRSLSKLYYFRMDNTLFNQIKDATDYLVIADGGGKQFPDYL
jgi:hypothetical protein